MSAQTILLKYIAFFEARGHKRIPNSPLVPENDPTTLFTSAGMQPLIPYLLGETHPGGKRLVNVQNSFRAQDIDEVGDNRHTTFFRMLGNWSLGDYFKKEEIPCLWEFLTSELKLPKDKLYITVFAGDDNVSYDKEAEEIWKKLLEKQGVEPKIFAGDVSKNWWSRSGVPANMPVGEIGGPDTEVYFKFDNVEHTDKCVGDDPTTCECGKYLEIANSVFIEFQKTDDGFAELPQKNVDFGGGLERFLAAVENESDIFQTSLLKPIVGSIEQQTGKKYTEDAPAIRIITDHFISAVFIASADVKPGNKEQGYILRRLIRRGLDNFYKLNGESIEPILQKIVDQYRHTDNELVIKYEEIKNTVLEEEEFYKKALDEGKRFIEKELEKLGDKEGDGFKGNKEITGELAFKALATFGLSPTQLRSLGYSFNEQDLAEKIKEHQKVSKAGATKKFAGGLADTSEQTVRGHTATHLMHQAIRDMLGTQIHQNGSNITAERVRFDFNLDRALTEEEITKLEQTVNGKIKENLPVFFEFMTLDKAKAIGAIGLFDEKYSDDVKIYLIGSRDPDLSYSKEFCGGPHVSFTSEVKSFKIIKQENIGNGLRRLYAKVG